MGSHGGQTKSTELFFDNVLCHKIVQYHKAVELKTPMEKSTSMFAIVTISENGSKKAKNNKSTMMCSNLF